eukprot:gb/GEZN01020223.1/.p1 GENE.gb/GEZN01020223.1/~~gb/GEZN01020223.1/.p1  ORF type:complete len:133 (+),score=20.94 gb/GEZN01020223.1/:217-615(+)
MRPLERLNGLRRLDITDWPPAEWPPRTGIGEQKLQRLDLSFLASLQLEELSLGQLNEDETTGLTRIQVEQVAACSTLRYLKLIQVINGEVFCLGAPAPAVLGAAVQAAPFRAVTQQHTGGAAVPARAPPGAT